VYYVPVEKDLEHENRVKERLDFWHTKMPYMGVRKLRNKLETEDGIKAGRKLIKRCMHEMGIYAVYPKPNQVWAVDITYIKMGKSNMYLTAIIDWYSRYLVGWALSDTLDTAPVLEAVTTAISKYGKPDIINSDQGSQFTSTEYVEHLKSNHIQQSMDGKGRWVDNVIIERWFRNLKVEYIYTNEINTPRELRAGIGVYITEYNHQRPHQSHGYQVPYEVFKGHRNLGIKAA
jgi:putative transposase